MDLAPIPLIKAIVPKVPLMGKTALWHTLGLSQTSKQWDLQTELTVSVLRACLSQTIDPVSKTQQISLIDPGVKSNMWIAQTTFPKPEDDVRQALFKVIESLKEEGQGKGGYMEPELLPVEAEWTGHRADATKNAADLNIPAEWKYKEMMKEVESPTTTIYFHGGAYYLMDPASHRPTTVKLARLTKGRVLSVRYRLAPQNPFPSALLDALVAYLSLIYPLPGSFHAPVDPKHLVISGDSAGGNLSIVLLQTLLEFRRQGLKIMWNGKEREVPLPAGTALNSGWFDITHSSPSCEMNSKYDYLPSPVTHPNGMNYPSCPIWPASPPRTNMYAEDEMLCHPLVSPLAAKSWAGSPPLYIETGEELLTDEDKHVAMKAAKQGVTVVLEQFEAMPHCFAMVLLGSDAGRRCFDGWVGFITACVENPESLATNGTWITAKTLQEKSIDVNEWSPYDDNLVLQRMRDRVKRAAEKIPETMSKL